MHVSNDFSEVDLLIRKTLKTRLKNLINNKAKLSKTYKKLYGRYNGKMINIKTLSCFLFADEK